MGWLTEVSLFLPNWAWIVIALILVAFVITAVALCIRYKNKEEQAAESSPTCDGGSESVSADNGEEANGTADGVPADQSRAETESGTEAAVKTGSAPADGEKREQTEANTENKKALNKVYHISKRKDNNKWQVKAAKSAKAIKLFNTQAEAIDFAKALAENQDARIVIHKEDGSFRNLKYKKK